MLKFAGSLFATSVVMLASNASAAYATAFSGAAAVWVRTADQSEFEMYWTTAESSVSCGSNCRRYTVSAWNDCREIKLGLLQGTFWKNGTDGTVPYTSYDFDFRSNSGGWISEDSSRTSISGSGRLYWATKDYGSSPLDTGSDYEIRFDYTYVPAVSGQRQIDLYYSCVV